MLAAASKLHDDPNGTVRTLPVQNPCHPQQNVQHFGFSLDSPMGEVVAKAPVMTRAYG